MSGILSLCPRLEEELRRVSFLEPPASAQWLRSSPPAVHRMQRSIELPCSSSRRGAGAALLGWDIHRAAGLRVAARGPARRGVDVALGMRLGPVWVGMACRVLAVVDEDHRVGLTYATLPGHPEQGIEEFLLVEDENGFRFEVSAVSRHAAWLSRLVPSVANRLQSAANERYLRAAIRLASRLLGQPGHSPGIPIPACVASRSTERARVASLRWVNRRESGP